MVARPLSPHLQIYRPQISSVLSIIHRLTGVALSISLFLLVYWLLALASGKSDYATAQSLFGSWLGTLILIAITFALCYHLCNGIRHLFWDVGVGFAINTMHRTGIAVIIAAALMTAGFWVLVCYCGG